MAGRPPKDEVIHDVQGTELRSKTPAESSISGALPKPPKFLSKEAKKKFKQLTKQLADRRAVTAGDADLIAIYCGTWERLQQALTNIREEGLIVTYVRLDAAGNPHDIERPNINLKIVEVSERACLSYLARLGLTPRDRELVRPTAPVSTGKELTEAERLDQEIASVKEQIAAERLQTAESQTAAAQELVDLDSIDLEVEL
jgi:P27 family predicted phage terminase small subunit